MMGSAVKHRPIGPPPGVDPARWAAEIEQAAHAHVAFAERVEYVARQREKQLRKAERRRRRLIWTALLAVLVLWVTVGPVWTAVAAGTVAWWKAGHPGLDRVQKTARDLTRPSP